MYGSDRKGYLNGIPFYLHSQLVCVGCVNDVVFLHVNLFDFI
jgi:hypothetical protein